MEGRMEDAMMQEQGGLKERTKKNTGSGAENG